VPQKRIPESLSVITDDGRNEVAVTELTVDGEVYAFDASTQPASSEGELILSTNPLKLNIVDGEALHVSSGITGEIIQYYCSSEYDASTARYEASFDVSDVGDRTRAPTWGDDGAKFYILEPFKPIIHTYDCSTPYNLETATPSAQLDVSSEANKIPRRRMEHRRPQAVHAQ